MNRRTFISIVSSLVATQPISQLHASRKENPDMPTVKLDEPWYTLASVMEHLFPASHESPGAQDIQAIRFLKNMLNTPDADEDEKAFIKKGVGWLNGMANKNHNKPFTELDENTKETVLRQIEQSNAGERWLSVLLTYLIEALLSDPAYGGNPDQIGWKWLEHQPGFPRPSADSLYYKLGKATFRRTKA